MLIIKLEQLTDEEINMLADIAVNFDAKTIEETLSRCVSFAWTCIEKANEERLQDNLIKLLGKDECL